MKRNQTPLIQTAQQKPLSPLYDAVAISEASANSIDGNAKSWVSAHVIDAAGDPITTAIIGGSDVTKYRDAPFAVAFLIHLPIVFLAGLKYGSFDFDVNTGDAQTDYTDGTADQNEGGAPMGVQVNRVLTHLAPPCVAVTLFTSALLTRVVIPRFPEEAVTVCLLSRIPSSIVLSFVVIASFPSLLTYIVSIVMVGFTIYYVIAAWKFIPFTACNLTMGVEGINRNYGVYFVAAFLSFAILAWVGFWSYTANGVSRTFGIGIDNYYKECGGKNDTGGAAADGCAPDWRLPLLLLSLYWTSVVIMNSIQTTVAGVMGTWCFDKDSASTCCSNAVLASLYRSYTYSFGSICFGSLLNAIIMVLRYMVREARRKRESKSNACSILLCVLQCILAMIEDIIEYFNRWAYIFVGVYGMSYLESGRAVLDLFRARGITTFVSHDMSSSVLNSVTMFSGLCTGFIGVGVDLYTGGTFLFGDDHTDSYKSKAFWISFLIGVVISSVMMSVIQGAVDTVIVCYADNPQKLLENHPEDTTKMTEAWTKVFPSVSFCPSSPVPEGLPVAAV